MAEVCVLADGRRVKFSLKRRDRDPYFLIWLRGSRMASGRSGRLKRGWNKRRALPTLPSSSSAMSMTPTPSFRTSPGTRPQADGRAHARREPPAQLDLDLRDRLENAQEGLPEFIRAGVDHPGDGRAIQAGPPQDL